CDDRIEARGRERTRLGGGDDEVDRDAVGDRGVARSDDLPGGDVDTAHDRASARELARDDARSGAEVENALSRAADVERGEQLVEALRRTGPVRRVVERGQAPVDRPAAVDGDAVARRRRI